MAIRQDWTIDVCDEIILAEAWTDTIGGVTRSEIVLRGDHPEEWLQRWMDEGWTLTRYRKAEDDG